MKRILPRVAVGSLLVIGIVLGAAPAQAASCPSGDVCLYRDSNGSGPELILSFSQVQLGQVHNLGDSNWSCASCSNGNWNDDMTSYVNNTGKVLCWFTDGFTWYSNGGTGHSMNNNNRLYNVTPAENDTASAVVVRDDYDPDHNGYWCS